MGRGKARPVYRPVFRIDRDTSGLVLIAGSRLAHNSLDGQLRGGTLQRKYIAVAHGRISKGEGVIDLPLARKKGSTVEREISPEGVRAITHYRLLKYLPPIDASVLELWLETGRTHQIRAHLSHLGHPLLGDGLYGGDTGLIKRQALHSCNIAFSHPQTGEKMNLRSKLPGDMEKITGAMTME
jgi:23S rRNA pseudouridine1911/1915/1917 synthase